MEWVVRRLTSDNAAAIGLHDRGVVAPGYKADINVIDFDRLMVHAPEVLYDLPRGGRRLVQRTEGYAATIVRVCRSTGTVKQPANCRVGWYAGQSSLRRCRWRRRSQTPSQGHRNVR